MDQPVTPWADLIQGPSNKANAAGWADGAAPITPMSTPMPPRIPAGVVATALQLKLGQEKLGHFTVRRLKGLLAGVTFVLVVASAGTSMLITTRQKALSEVSRYNVTWLTSVAPVEVMRLETAILKGAVPGTGVDQDEIQLRLDIVKSRLSLLEAGETGDFIRGRQDLETVVAHLRTMIDQAQPIVEAPASIESTRRLLALVSPLAPQLTKLAAAANARGGELVAEDQAQLGLLHTILSTIVAGLTICGFGLMGVLTWHNKLLRRAHAEVAMLADDLQITGNELVGANARVKTAMTEVQFQNRILQERDHTLNTQNARFDAALNNMSQALCMVDQAQRLIVCNVRFLELLGLNADTVIQGAPIAHVFSDAVEAARLDKCMLEAIRAEQSTLVTTGCPGSFFKEDPSGRAIAVSHQPMPGGGWVATYEDISERRRAEARIQFMAHHDALTGLPNRLMFEDRLAHRLNGIHQDDGTAAVLCVDLDHFKTVNDTLGHSAGDLLLEQVAIRLRGCVRDTDFVARLGGDEFAILHASPSQPDHAEALAKRLVEVVGAPYSIDGQVVVVGASVGIAIATGQQDDVDRLLKNADTALYRAKADGRGAWRLFEPEMDVQLQVRRETELSLRDAVTNSELQVFYQPLFDLAAEKVTGFEALLRWPHAIHGYVPPAHFIPIAEEVGLIDVIGEWVLHQACKDAATWPGDARVAVNLSPIQFRSTNLVQAIRSALAASGLAPHRLELEITESALLKDSDKVLAILHELRNLGVGTALDDFGTGYSSLSYLLSFPFDKIKIDQSFVRQMSSRPDCLAIVHSVAELAHKLGMTTTAEGVETPEQLEQVRRAGCNQAQGYLFDRPKPATDIAHWLTPGATIPAF